MTRSEMKADGILDAQSKAAVLLWDEEVQRAKDMFECFDERREQFHKATAS